MFLDLTKVSCYHFRQPFCTHVLLCSAGRLQKSLRCYNAGCASTPECVHPATHCDSGQHIHAISSSNRRSPHNTDLTQTSADTDNQHFKHVGLRKHSRCAIPRQKFDRVVPVLNTLESRVNGLVPAEPQDDFRKLLSTRASQCVEAH